MEDARKVMDRRIWKVLNEQRHKLFFSAECIIIIVIIIIVIVTS